MRIMIFFLLAYCCSAVAAVETHLYQSGGESYSYRVTPTGENYTFEFDRSPGDATEKLAAGNQVLRQIYRDDTIDRRYSDHYIRERARCYVFDGRFHSYTLCFLPNDFNRSESARFWGFTTQMPNAMWLATRILLPVALAFALLFYWSGRRRPGG